MTYLLPIFKNHQYIENSNLSKEIKEDQNMNKYKSMDTVSNIMKLSVKELVQSHEELFQLDVENPQFLIGPTCRFESANRSKFAEHLSSHNMSLCSPNFKTAFRYSPDLTLHQDKINRSFTILEEDGTQQKIEVDKSKLDQVNLQSDIKQNKSFRERKICKHCDFIANTKVEYWNHMRYHIKGFTCSECSFITRYKHHMTHHWLSVHDGSKPFKCTKCSYSCVSKSMLTSHLKKHSNIYPYRCANCTYKTKFCNALKKHLRKKEHEPAMVLNADGTPNPLSVIDVYGTKRGPKQKLSIGKQDDLEKSTNQSMTINSNHQPSSTSTSLFLPSQSPITEDLTTKLNDTNWIIQNSIKQNQSVTDLVALNLSNHLFREDVTLKEIKQPHVEMLMKFVTSKLDYVQNSPTTCFNTNDVNELHISDKNVKTTDSLLYKINSQLNSQEDESLDTPLDLRITEESEKNHCQLLATSSPKIIGTNKRKGRAMKLERRAIEENTKSEQEEVESPKSSKINTFNFRGENQNIKNNKDITDFERYNGTCHFCDIRFGNIVLFNMHMNCHGPDSPYICTVCGHCCRDKISFFSHIYTHKG